MSRRIHKPDFAEPLWDSYPQLVERETPKSHGQSTNHSDIYSPAGLCSKRLTHMQNHGRERTVTGKDLHISRAPAWLFDMPHKRRVADHGRSTVDLISHMGARAVEQEQALSKRTLRRTGYFHPASQQNLNIATGQSPSSVGFPKTLTEGKHLSTRVQRSCRNDIRWNVAGSEDMYPPSTQLCTKADLPPSRRMVYENDRRLMPYFWREVGGTSREVKSPLHRSTDIYSCLLSNYADSESVSSVVDFEPSVCHRSGGSRSGSCSARAVLQTASVSPESFSLSPLNPQAAAEASLQTSSEAVDRLSLTDPNQRARQLFEMANRETPTSQMLEWEQPERSPQERSSLPLSPQERSPLGSPNLRYAELARGAGAGSMGGFRDAPLRQSSGKVDRSSSFASMSARSNRSPAASVCSSIISQSAVRPSLKAMGRAAAEQMRNSGHFRPHQMKATLPC